MFLNENKCKFYDKYFIDDLYPYKFNSNDSTITYYDSGSALRTSSVDMSGALDIIKSLSVSQDKDCWIPAFINLDNSNAKSRVLFRGATSFNENLGIENAITIQDPLFQSWNINDGKMVSDWILTSDIIPFSPRYGILFWYKNSSSLQEEKLRVDQIPINAIVQPAQNYSYGTVSISTNTKLIKKDNDTFYIFDSGTPEVRGPETQSVLPSTDPQYFRISKLLSKNPELNKEDILFKLISNDLIESKPSLSIWIPSGETYSYVRSEEEERELRVSGKASSSYLSPILSNIYREIYHVLTLRYPKNFTVTSGKGADAPINILDIFDPLSTDGSDKKEETTSLRFTQPVPFFTPDQSKLIKKLAYCLATFPTMDRTTVSLLNTDAIYNIVQEYLTLNKESSLADTLIKISKEMSILISANLNIVDSQTYLSGVVNSKEQLFYRLISKYGSKLRLSGEASLSYKTQLKYGPHVKINQDIITRCDASLNNQTVFNNVEFNVGEFIVKTKMGPDASKLQLSNKKAPGQNTTIPLWDVVKKDLKNSRMPITAGPDLEVDFDDDKLLTSPPPKPTEDTRTQEERDAAPRWIRGPNGRLIPNGPPEDPTGGVPWSREIKIELDKAIADVGGGFFDPNVLGGEDIDVLWTRISGPDCLKFSDGRLSKISGQQVGGSSFVGGGRYAVSTDPNPTVYVKKPGRYVVQLRVKASFGIIYDNVVIHVVSKKNQPNYKRKEALSVGKTQYLKPQNQLVVMAPNIRECYFGKQGVCWISYCDASVKTPLINRGVGDVTLPEVQSLGNNYHKFAMPMPKDNNDNKIINNNPASLTIKYDCNNTTIDISHITLTNLMDNNPECYNCQSLYEGILGSDGFILDVDPTLSFADPSNNDLLTNLDGHLETLTTSKTLTKAYGGFSEKIVKTFGVDIPFHPRPDQPLTDISTSGELLSDPRSQDGKIQYLCHDTDIQHNTSVTFNKGCFHPYHGWIKEKKYNNQSSVLKFQPYHRPVQSFKGPGMYDLSNDFADGKPRIYKSSIGLKVKEAAHDPVGGEGAEGKAKKEAAEKQEISDHIVHYGYKSLGGDVGLKSLALNDEYDPVFPTEDDAPVSASEYCDDRVSESIYTASYEFSRPGAHLPVKDRTSDPLVRWKRDGASSIGDIEVKINFLNYINPKDLVVWLEIEGCAEAAARLNPPPNDDGKQPPPKDAWYEGSYASTFTELSKLPDTEIKKYLYELWKINNNNLLLDEDEVKDFSRPFYGNPEPKMEGVYRVFLLNRDHISSTDYNINLKFSDLLDIDKLTHNHNNSSVLYVDNNISQSIDNTINLAPTLSAAGYSDEQIYRYKKIILENKLLNNSHSFRKVSGMSLFGAGFSEPPKPENSSGTTFTLCVAVVGESDTFEPYDRIFNNEQACGFSSSVLQNRSNLVTNSICSWELILHRSKDSFGFVPGDSLGSIKYESEPDIPGHNFIADMTDKLHLLPPVALNAPNAYLLDGTLCRYSKEVLNQPTYLRPPPLNISPLTFMIPTSIATSMVAIAQIEAGLNQQAREIFNWLGDKRRRDQKEIFDREWFVPVYDKYPYGGHDKALLSVSKDGKLFYKMEAAIFRYNNSIVMKKNKHHFCKLNYKSFLKNLSIFEMKSIPILDNKILPKLLKPYIKKYKNIYEARISRQLKDKDILFLETPPNADPTNSDSFEALTMSDEERQIELLKNVCVWDAKEEKAIYIGDCNFSQLLQNEDLSTYSNLADLAKNEDSLDHLAMDYYRLKYIKGLRAYNFFLENREVTTFQDKFKEDITEEDLQNIENLENRLKEAVQQQKEETDDEARNEISIRINDLENQIFDLKYAKLTARIKNIGYIFDGTDYYTIIILSNSDYYQHTISLAPDQSKRIVIYDKSSTIDNNDIKKPIPFDLWSAADRPQVSFKSPEIHPVCWGAGNYGYGGNAVNLNQISSLNIKNNITPLIDRIDSNKNSKIKIDPPNQFQMNKFQMLDEYDDDPTPINGSISSLGYGYNLNDLDDSGMSFNSNASYMPSNFFSVTGVRITTDINTITVSTSHANYSRLKVGAVLTGTGITAEEPNTITVITAINGSTITLNNNATATNANATINVRVENLNLSDSINHRVYVHQNNAYSFIELNVSLRENTLDQGIIMFDKDVQPTIVYGFKDDYKASIDLLKNRLAELSTIIKDKNKKTPIKKASKTYSQIDKPSDFDLIVNEMETLIQEQNTILYYINLLERKEGEIVPTIPQVSVSVEKSTSGSISFQEHFNDNYYWINIDPEQGCSIDKDKTVKILKEVSFNCELFNGVVTLKAGQICGGLASGSVNGQDESIDIQGGGRTKYTLSQEAINRIKNSYSELTWPADDKPNYEITRKFFLNLHGEEKAQLVNARYTYICPISPSEPDITPDGEIENKVYNIFNLDKTDDLIIEFKRIPRAIRGVDTQYEMFEPDAEGNLTKSITPPAGGPIDASLRMWKCLDPTTGAYVKPPPYYNWLNEMIFRLYFGSADGLEYQGRNKTISKDIMYWIPYDYS